MKIVCVESPFFGNVSRNTAYARAALRDCLIRGEAPYASHLLYTQPGVLNDNIDSDRTMGIDAGFAFKSLCKTTVVYEDFGVSNGMQKGIRAAEALGHEIEYRTLPDFKYQEEFNDIAITPWVEKLFEAALEKWGESTQIFMSIGEIGEYLELFGKEVQGRTTPCHWIEEISDVLIIFAQLAYNYKDMEIDIVINRKLQKLADKLNADIDRSIDKA